MMRLFGYTMIYVLMQTSVTLVHAQGAQDRKGASVGSLSATGTVVDWSQTPLPGVPVQVTGPKGKTFVVTDENGNWSLYNLPAGFYEAQAIPAHNEANVRFSVEDKVPSGSVVAAPTMVMNLGENSNVRARPNDP
ncbi:MAG: hypothetical protein ACLPSW_12335 [Roseiarcus sp.]